MATERQEFIVGGDDREPDTDQSGIYAATLENLAKIAKTEQQIENEIAKYGKDPEKIDRYQYTWDFAVSGFDQTMRVWSGTFFGDKAKATDLAAALLGHRPSRSEQVTASQLWDKPCQVLVEFDQERGRNKITKVMPPKRAAGGLGIASRIERDNAIYEAAVRSETTAPQAPVQEQQAPTFAEAAQRASRGPSGPSEAAVQEAVADRQAAMAGAAEEPPDDLDYLASLDPGPDAEA